jgi:hypothetical protein
MRTTRSFHTLLFVLAVLALSLPSFAQVRISVAFGPLLFPPTSNLSVLARATSGLLATGLGTTSTMIITGCRALGCWLRKSAFFGRRRTGRGWTARMSSMTAIGVRKSAFMVELFTASAISVPAT